MNTNDSIRFQLEVSHQWQLETEQAGLRPQVEALERWQKDRLRQTYGDFWDRESHREAMQFFVEELYAPPNLHLRNQQMTKMLPLLFKIMPPSVLVTVEEALSAQSLAQSLDFKTAHTLRTDGIDVETMSVEQYAAAYRSSAPAEEREEQIRQIVRVGEALEHLVNLPMIYATLKMARWPAKVAGLSDLQTFLEHGFHAFDEMGGADDFLRSIEQREMAIAQQLRDLSTDELDFAWRQFW
ncbi:MAG: hypothetical protein AAF358_09130 [Pseudomonadota bacterium]